MTAELLFVGIFFVAFLYAAVGHAGASGYIAVMALAGLAPETIRPAALVLNILVASLATWHFVRAGYFSWQLFWPLAILAVPLAFYGGSWKLSPGTFHLIVGLVLWASALSFLLRPAQDGIVRRPPRWMLIGSGGALGGLAGLTGTGGGIFLTPLLLHARWALTKTASAVSALFILVNSAAGLIGFMGNNGKIPDSVWGWAAVAMIGGWLGAYCGSRRFPVGIIRRLLVCVLLIAGAKLIFAT
jgi:uncharacterized protein